MQSYLLLLGSIVQLGEECPEQRLACLPAAEGVRVMAQQECKLLICLALHLQTSPMILVISSHSVLAGSRDSIKNPHT